MKPEFTPVSIRMPQDLLDKITLAAFLNERTVTGEIIFNLRRVFEPMIPRLEDKLTTGKLRK